MFRQLMRNAHVLETWQQNQRYVIDIAPMVGNYSVQCNQLLSER